MGSGFAEWGLIVFTSLAPAGALAFAAVALRVLFAGSTAECLRRSSRCLIVPLSAAIVGLVASATQLGTPANVLNVFNHLGVSPLSNEAFFSALFLLVAGVYWLVTFYEVLSLTLLRMWLGAACAAALAMVGGISCAYSMYTIPLWNSPLVPINLWCSGLFGGALLALIALRYSSLGCSQRDLRIGLGVAAGALVVEVACCLLQNALLAGLSNAVVHAVDLVPDYPLMIAACAVLGSASLVGLARFLPQRGWHNYVGVSASVTAGFIGIFLVRMAFYGLHMTSGF